MFAALAEMDRDLIIERTKSGLAAAKARGVKLGRRLGHNPSDKHKERVLPMIDAGKPYREIADKLKISKTTVVEIVKRYRTGIAMKRGRAAV